MLGGNEFRLRQGFAFGKTLVRRKSAARRAGPRERHSYREDFTKRRTRLCRVLLFEFRALWGASPDLFNLLGTNESPRH